MAGELIVFPDIEAWAKAYLDAQLALRGEPYTDGVTVSTKVPQVRPARFINVRRDGGARESVITERARLGIRVWAMTTEDAHDLAMMTRAILLASAGEGPVRRTEDISGPSYVPEESTQELRYLVMELVVRGSAL